MKKITYLISLVIITSLVCKSFASEQSIYNFKWLDKDEKIYVIQNKEHVKSHRYGLDLSFIDSNNTPYQDTSGYSASLTYYLSENWSIDFTYKMYQNKDSSNLKNLLNDYDTSIEPLIRRIDDAKLLHISWIPFYGKINTFNRIFFFDWGIGLGLGLFNTAGNYETFAMKNMTLIFKKESDFGYNIKSFVKIFTRSNFILGFEYNLTGVQTTKNIDGTKEILSFSDTMLTIGYLF